MPRFDGTGPEGKGPLTGGGRGHCVSADGKPTPCPPTGPARDGRGGGRGMPGGSRRGRGRR